MTFVAHLAVDSALLDKQIALVTAYLDSYGRGYLRTEHAPDAIQSHLARVFQDVVLGHGISTSNADGTVEIVYRPRLGAEFEVFLAAFRAGEQND